MEHNQITDRDRVIAVAAANGVLRADVEITPAAQSMIDLGLTSEVPPPLDADFVEMIRAGMPEQQLGKAVKRRREDLGWSQDQLAGRLVKLGIEMHQTTVAKLEQAKRPIRVNELWALAAVLRMPVDVLLDLRDLQGESDSRQRAIALHVMAEDKAVIEELDDVIQYLQARRANAEGRISGVAQHMPGGTA